MLGYKDTITKIDAIGITAYIGCGDLGSSTNSARTALMTVDQILDRCMSHVREIDREWDGQAAAVRRAVEDYNARIRNASAVSPSPSPGPYRVNETRVLLQAKDIPLVVYEGGPSLVEAAAIERGSETAGLTNLFIQANAAPRMEEVYLAYLRAFEKVGLLAARNESLSHPYMHYSSAGFPSKYGSWGLLTTMMQPRNLSAKARALDRFIEEVSDVRAKSGCTNPEALNFDPLARYNNRSCVFPPTKVTSNGGGNVTFESSSVKLAFPPAALAVDTDITVEEVSSAPVVSGNDREVIGPVYRFGPAGTQFLLPVEVRY
jgi:hypothetical protein